MLRARRPPGRIALFRFVPEIGRRGDRQHAADRLDPVHLPMVVDERDHHFARRSSSACAKYAEAFFRISFARRSSKFSLSSCFSRGALVGGQAGTLAGVPLGLAHPPAQRFDRTADLLGDGSNRRPLRRMVRGMVEDHPDGAFTQFRGVLAGSSHGPHPLLEWALR